MCLFGFGLVTFQLVRPLLPTSMRAIPAVLVGVASAVGVHDRDLAARDDETWVTFTDIVPDVAASRVSLARFDASLAKSSDWLLKSDAYFVEQRNRVIG